MCQINNQIVVCNRKLINFYKLKVVEASKTPLPTLINDKYKFKVLFEECVII